MIEKDTQELINSLAPWKRVTDGEDWQLVRDRFINAASELEVIQASWVKEMDNEKLGEYVKGRVAAAAVIRDIVQQIEGDAEQYISLLKSLEDPRPKLINKLP